MAARSMEKCVSMLVGMGAVCLLGLAPASAQAVELTWDPECSPNCRVRVHTPRHPRRYYVGVTPVRVVQPLPPPPTRVHVRVHRPAPPPPTVVVRSQPSPPRTVVVRDVTPPPEPAYEPVQVDPYDTDGLVVAGAGVGGLFFFGDGVTNAAAAYKLHLGLAVGPAEFALRFDLVPDAFELQAEDGGANPAALYTMGASFNYRFLPDATVHPVAGVGIESILLDPREGETGNAFAVTARAGLELAYPLADGALALGIDATGHHPFGATDRYEADLVDMLGFGAYADYRF